MSRSGVEGMYVMICLNARSVFARWHRGALRLSSTFAYAWLPIRLFLTAFHLHTSNAFIDVARPLNAASYAAATRILRCVASATCVSSPALFTRRVLHLLIAPTLPHCLHIFITRLHRHAFICRKPSRTAAVAHAGVRAGNLWRLRTRAVSRLERASSLR